MGVDLLVAGSLLAGLGYVLAQSIPIAALGADVMILGALVLLIVPDPIPQDSYKALLKDSIANVEIILEESRLEERAYFVPTVDGEVRAFIPAVHSSEPLENVQASRSSLTALIQSVSKSPGQFIAKHGSEMGLVLIPPGNSLVALSKIRVGEGLEDALSSSLVNFSDFASSITLVEEREAKSDMIKIMIAKPTLSSNLPFFQSCLGTPVSCIVSCVVAVAKGKPVRIQEERIEKGYIRLTLQVIEEAF